MVGSAVAEAYGQATPGDRGARAERRNFLDDFMEFQVTKDKAGSF